MTLETLSIILFFATAAMVLSLTIWHLLYRFEKVSNNVTGTAIIINAALLGLTILVHSFS